MIAWEGESRELVDELLFKQAFIYFEGNRSKMALALKVSIRTVRNKVTKYQLYELDTPEWREKYKKQLQGTGRELGGEP